MKIFAAALSLFVMASSLIYGDVRNLAKQVVDEIQNENIEQLMSTFGVIQESLEDSEDVITEMREFLETFIAEVNARYSVQLTLPQLCEIAKKSLDLFQISEEDRKEILEVFDLLAGQELKANSVWPLQWNWNDLSKAGFQSYDRNVGFALLEIVSGSVFVMTGQVLGLFAGVGLVYDGIYRITNGGQKEFWGTLDEWRKQILSY